VYSFALVFMIDDEDDEGWKEAEINMDRDRAR
jgi:hypothetical protein